MLSQVLPAVGPAMTAPSLPWLRLDSISSAVRRALAASAEFVAGASQPTPHAERRLFSLPESTMSRATLGETVWDLPPLILHPFNERVPPAALLENSKAAFMLSDLIRNEGTDSEDLKRRLLSGRYSDIRML